MSKIINVNGFVEFIHEEPRELYHAELLRLIERYMGPEFCALVEDELDELVEALREADEADSLAADLKQELEYAREEIDRLTEENW